jgi:hypothetical protein
MPIIPPTPVANQITPSGQRPYTAQFNFGQAIGAVQSWNPNCSSAQVEIFLNSALRKLVDRRLWYGLMTKGQIVTPPFYQGGQVSLTTGSASVVGSGTLFTSAMVGRSLRVGYNNPIYNIISVTDSTHLTIELPWGGASIASTGFFITQYYFSIPNIKYIYAAINLQLQYRLWTNITQNSLDTWDPSRLQLIYPKVIATMPPDKDGNFQIELWPTSMVQQAIPYIAYVQPPNLREDTDNLPAFLRGDILVSHAIADALRYRSKDNPYYSESVALQIAKEKMMEFEGEALRMESADENLNRQDVTNWSEMFPYADLAQPGGAMLSAMSAVSAGGGDW